MLIAMLLAPTATLASTPGWQMTVTTNPAASSSTDSSHVTVQVSKGNYFQASVTIKNSGKSNIAKLYLEDDGALGLYSATASRGTCRTTSPLYCDLGALSKGASVTVSVVYSTPADGSVTGTMIFANTSGVSYSDGGSSHGDALMGGITVGYAGTGAAGGYVIDANQPIGTSGGNQQTTILPPTNNIGVTIQQQGATGNTACGTSGFGDLAVTNVGGGATFSPFKTTLTYSTSLMNGETELSQVSVCHTYDAGHTPAFRSITQACNSSTAPTNAPCINARFEGQTGNDDRHLVRISWWQWVWVQGPLDADDFTTLIIDVWDTTNGGLRGAN
jgi:Domain of unknown function DUF11